MSSRNEDAELAELLGEDDDELEEGDETPVDGIEDLPRSSLASSAPSGNLLWPEQGGRRKPTRLRIQWEDPVKGIPCEVGFLPFGNNTPEQLIYLGKKAGTYRITALDDRSQPIGQYRTVTIAEDNPTLRAGSTPETVESAAIRTADQGLSHMLKHMQLREQSLDKERQRAMDVSISASEKQASAQEKLYGTLMTQHHDLTAETMARGLQAAEKAAQLAADAAARASAAEKEAAEKIAVAQSSANERMIEAQKESMSQTVNVLTAMMAKSQADAEASAARARAETEAKLKEAELRMQAEQARIAAEQKARAEQLDRERLAWQMENERREKAEREERDRRERREAEEKERRDKAEREDRERRDKAEREEKERAREERERRDKMEREDRERRDAQDRADREYKEKREADDRQRDREHRDEMMKMWLKQNEAKDPIASLTGTVAAFAPLLAAFGLKPADAIELVKGAMGGGTPSLVATGMSEVSGMIQAWIAAQAEAAKAQAQAEIQKAHLAAQVEHQRLLTMTPPELEEEEEDGEPEAAAIPAAAAVQARSQAEATPAEAAQPAPTEKKPPELTTEQKQAGRRAAVRVVEVLKSTSESDWATKIPALRTEEPDVFESFETYATSLGLNTVLSKAGAALQMVNTVVSVLDRHGIFPTVPRK